uniref:Collagen IV NC1 domain-containing protein n=1 Tax=Steinernema glaseri TaxID=37863 RepID=A0A1I8A8U3_9BILA
MMSPVTGRAVEPYISRCVVCESPTPVLAVHSQDTAVPECPRGWHPVYPGYSFMMATAAGAEGTGQNLQSPGSCLEQFISVPVFECHGRGTCNHYNTNHGFWLVSVDKHNMFRKPMGETLKAGAPEGRVSRCNVCLKDAPRY